MQTFLPYEDFGDCAIVLDDKRLRKQQDECEQILSALLNFGVGWRNHPAVQMWRGSELYLYDYARAIALVHRARFGDNRITWYQTEVMCAVAPLGLSSPWWLGDTRLHISHRSNLTRKDTAHYARFWPDVPSDIPYFWPTKAGA